MINKSRIFDILAQKDEEIDTLKEQKKMLIEKWVTCELEVIRAEKLLKIWQSIFGFFSSIFGYNINKKTSEFLER